MTDVTVVAPADSGADGIGTYTGDLVEALPDAVAVRWVTIPDQGTANPLPFLRAAVAASLTDDDVVHVQHEYGLFGPKSLLGWLFLPVLAVLARLRGRQLVVTPHNSWSRETLAEEEGLLALKWAYLLATNHLIALVADELVFLSTNGRETFQETVPWVDGVVFAHGVPLAEREDIDRTEAKAAFGYDPADTVVVEPGYVRPQKGPERFLELARDLPDVEFLLAGGPLNPGDETYVDDLAAAAPGNVQVTGVLDDDRFQAAFAAADLVVLPYVKVTQSGVFNWCAAHACPVAASDHDYFRGLADDWDCVALFDGSDPDDVRETVTALLADDAARERLSVAIAEYAEAHSFAGAAADHADLYADLSA